MCLLKICVKRDTTVHSVTPDFSFCKYRLTNCLRSHLSSRPAKRAAIVADLITSWCVPHLKIKAKGYY